MADTSIEWTDKVWNPTVGCTRVSAGCDNCYALRMARRLAMMGRPEYQDLIANFWANDSGLWFWNGTVRCLSERLDQPLRWRKPRRIFVNSMGDLFHEAVPSTFLDRTFAVMALARHHTFIVLTKRPERARHYLDPKPRSIAGHNRPGLIYYRCLDYGATVPQTYKREWPLPNVWLGYSASTQKDLEAGIGDLLATPAAVRILSLEPLLGPIDLTKLYGPCGYYCSEEHGHVDHGREPADWVVVGGESGPRARPCAVDWIRGIVTQCRESQVPCFVKQLGTKPAEPGCVPGHVWVGRNPMSLHRVRDSKGADPSEWPEDLRIREFPHG